MGGIDSLEGRVILYDGYKLDYAPEQKDRFIEMWNEGEPASRIAEYFGIKMIEVFLLVSWGELDDWIKPRPGGYKGSKKHKWKRREKIVIDDMPTLQRNGNRNRGKSISMP